MDIDLNTLLVALMFVTILSMGIGNILGTLADIFNHASAARRDRVHVTWIVLLLIIHFNLFWHTKSILAVEGWEFGGFLLTMAGPVLMFFATSILLTSPPEDAAADLHGFFVGLGRRFFAMVALLQAWIVVVGLVMTGTFLATDLVNVAFVVLAVVLAMSTAPRSQFIGVLSAWGLGLASLVVRWLTLPV